MSQSNSKQSVVVDCRKSQNVTSHQPMGLLCTVDVAPKSAVVCLSVCLSVWSLLSLFVRWDENATLRLSNHYVRANDQSSEKKTNFYPTSPKPLNTFWWNLKFRTTPKNYPTQKIDFNPMTWVVSANTQFAIVTFYSLSFLFLHHVHSSHLWIDFDDSYVI